MTELIPNLFIGNWQEGQAASANCYVITVAHDSPFIGNEKYDLVDGPGNSLKTFMDAVSAVVASHKSGYPTMVHCHGGRSRSATVCVAAIHLLTGKSIFEAYEHVIARHDKTRIHPYLAEFLIA